MVNVRIAIHERSHAVLAHVERDSDGVGTQSFEHGLGVALRGGAYVAALGVGNDQTSSGMAATMRSSAAHPAAPYCSKKAGLGLKAAACRWVACTMPWQNASIASTPCPGAEFDRDRVQPTHKHGLCASSSRTNSGDWSWVKIRFARPIIQPAPQANALLTASMSPPMMAVKACDVNWMR